MERTVNFLENLERRNENLAIAGYCVLLVGALIAERVRHKSYHLRGIPHRHYLEPYSGFDCFERTKAPDEKKK